MAVIISRRSSYCPNFATAPNEVLKSAREMTTRTLVEMVMELGLFELLRREKEAG
ncbi:hypothetical protein [Corynebacterium casei]|uniref:hypothetical protein n=1 Tax=Corynebacterium casei TaxID=160386 RepID=UPI003F99B598